MSTDITPKSQSYSFLNGSFPIASYATNADIAFGDIVPRGFRGVITEQDLIFRVSGGGVRIEKQLSSGGRIRQTAGITASQSGLGALVLDEGERIVLVCDSTGTGTVDIIFDGRIEMKLDASLLPKPISYSTYGRGGF